MKRRLFIPYPLLRLAVALGFTLLTTIILVQSSSQPMMGPPAPPGKPTLEREILLTLAHIAAFMLLVTLWYYALLPVLPFQRALFVAVAFTLIYGVLTELAQSFVPDRQVSLFDIAVNWSSAAMTGWWIARGEGARDNTPQ